MRASRPEVVEYTEVEVTKWKQVELEAGFVIAKWSVNVHDGETTHVGAYANAIVSASPSRTAKEIHHATANASVGDVRAREISNAMNETGCAEE